MSYYAILRGPLGVGKSEVSRRVATVIEGSYISIDEILEVENLERWDADCISEASFLDANRFAADRARPDLSRGKPVVFDGNFYWRSAIEDLLERLPWPHVVCTLTAPLSVCTDRDSARVPSHGAKSAQQVYHRTLAFDYGTVIDATGALDTVVAAVLGELRRLGDAPT